MSVTEQQVIDALRPVRDPELHRSIVELEMVRGVTIEGANVRVLIALTVAGCPMKDEIDSLVTNALLPIDGIDNVEVAMTVMAREDLAAVREKMNAHGHSHGDRPSPFATSNVRVLAVTSGKGGVGKSTIAVNLAVALAKIGQRVGILDADVYGFSVPAMLGIDDDPELDGEMIVPPSAHGVSCISIAYFVEPGRPVMWRGPMLHKAIDQFVSDVQWGELDYLIIDTPPGTGDVALSISKKLPRAETIVVTTPQPAAQVVAERSGAMAREIGSPVLGIVENMSWYVDAAGNSIELFGNGGGGALSKSLNSPLLAQIPLVESIRTGGDDGVPAVMSKTEAGVASVFEELANAVVSAGPRRVYREELKVT